MEQKVIDKLKLDIKNAKKFFERTGKDIEEAYKCENPDIDKVNENGIRNVILYIPESKTDLYVTSLN